MPRNTATRLIRKPVTLAAVLAAGASLAACASLEPKYAIEGGARAPVGKPQAGRGGGYKVGQPYQVNGVWYYPKEQPDYDETGVASWYGDAFHLKATANGELFDMNGVSAAHKTLPLPSMVEVTNLENGKKLKVRVNDRGPFVGDRLIDLSYEAARELGFERKGLARVRVRYLGPAPTGGPDPFLTYAKAEAARRPAAPRPGVAQTLIAQTPRAAAAPPPESFRVAQTAPPAAAVSAQALPPLGHAPLTGAALPDLRKAPPKPAVTSPAAEPEVVLTSAPAEAGFRIQAGAFSSQANAEKAVAQLAGAGQAFIEPMDRGGGTLYRVLLSAPSDEAEAYALRDKVAEFGFADARVVRSF